MSSVTDPAGNRKEFRYNDAGELIEATDIRGNVTHYTYHTLGKIETITDGTGRTCRYQYLPGGRLEKVIHPDGKSVIFAYDNLGRVKTKTNGSGYCLNYHYDSMGRILKVSSNTGQEKKYTYDALGNIVTMTDACGNTTAYEYTPCGKLASVTDALGNRTWYEYDGADRLIHICQRGEEDVRESWYLRNPLGQVETIRDALGGEEHYRYDALGRVTEKVDRDYFCTKYYYTADGNVERILYGDGTFADMEYTALGQLSLIKDWLGETRIERNREGNPLRITDHAGRSVDYEWGKYGERKSVTYSDGRTMRFGYDSLMHLNELVSIAPGKADARIVYQYDPEGRLTEKSMQDRMGTSYSYNQAGQLSELIHRDTCGILDRICYQYDAMGNKIQVEKERRGLQEESGAYTYGYDALQRLICVEKDGTLLREYTYDAFGNRTGMEDYRCGRKIKSVYNTLNQLLTEEIRESCGVEGVKTFGKDFQKTYQKKFRYDKRGNLAAEYQEDQLVHGYEYNAMNRMIRAWDAKGEEALYRYNGLGQRTGRNEQEYLLDLTKPYNNLLQIRENEKCQSFCWDNGIVLAEEQGMPPRYCFSDEMGSPLRVLYGTGKGDVYGYDEFGNPFDERNKRNTEAGYSRQGEGQPFGYTGYRYDEVSGTYYAQAREYLQGRGRFAGEDVVRGNGLLPMSLNRYVYCLNNPLQYVDPSGYTSEEDAKQLIIDNAKYINEAAEKFGLDPNVLAGCIYSEQVLNVDLKDKFDTTLVKIFGLDSSVGISQVKVSTAKTLQEKGYMPEIEGPSFIEGLFGKTQSGNVADALEDNETNIQYAAAYLKYQIDEWTSAYPQVGEDIAIQGTLYNLGHEKMRDGFIDSILGKLFAGFKDQRIPHSEPEANPFGEYVLNSYDLMAELLGGETCEN